MKLPEQPRLTTDRAEKGRAIDINESYATTAIRDNFPQLNVQEEDVKFVGSGYDNAAFRVKGEYIFRFSIQTGPWNKGERETRLLPMLEKVLDIPVPHVEYAALQSNGQHFMGYKMIRGVPFTKEKYDALEPEARARAMDRLGNTLKALFAFPLEEAHMAQVPDREMRAWHARILDRAEPYLNESFTSKERAKLKEEFDAYFSNESNFSYKPSLVNTDIASEHILFDETSNDISGIIDWTDVCITDPALAFPTIYRQFGDEFTQELLERSLGEREMGKIRFLALATSLRRFAASREHGQEDRTQKYLAEVKQDLAS